LKTDPFGAAGPLSTADGDATIYRLRSLTERGIAPGLDRMPFSIKVLLEAVLRNVDGELVTADDVRNLAECSWCPGRRTS
jgi:aconitate hydratase